MSAGKHAMPGLTDDEALELGIEAWIYAFPLVVMECTRRVMVNMPAPDNARLRAPLGRFAHGFAHPDATFRDVVRPNADTLYSMLWYDVGVEPLVLSPPPCPQRYHVLPLMDMWTDIFATVGTHATAGTGGHFAIVGPGWHGELPAGVRRIASPTDVGWILGRVQTNGPADFEAVRSIQAGMAAAPLSRWQKGDTTLEPGRVDPSVDMITPPLDQALSMRAAEFFRVASILMQRNPPHASDAAMVLRLERLGFFVGMEFDLAAAPEPVRRSLDQAVVEAQARLLRRGMARRHHRQGWVLPAILGVYGNEYLARAFTAYRGLGALPPTEALYPTALADADGNPLHGSQRYRLHFAKDALPPVRAFWSLTMYGEDQFFVANPIDRFAIGDRDALSFNADGSLDLWMQHEMPTVDRQSNWLPAPAGPFTMNLRLYAPRPEAVDGAWNPPPIQRL